MELALIGVSHKTAPVEVRERLAFPSDKIRAALASLLEKTHAAEAMILSTCNRVEIVVAQGPDAQLVQDFICEYHQIPGRIHLPASLQLQECRRDSPPVPRHRESGFDDAR